MNRIPKNEADLAAFFKEHLTDRTPLEIYTIAVRAVLRERQVVGRLTSFKVAAFGRALGLDRAVVNNVYQNEKNWLIRMESVVNGAPSRFQRHRFVAEKDQHNKILIL